MKAKLLLILSAILCLAAPCGAKKQKLPVDIRIGSYNLRMQNLDKDENVWEYRHPRLVQSIKENNFDIFGVQEVTGPAQEQLRSDFADRYECVFFSPYSQDGKGGRAQGVFYDKKKFKLLEYHYFWPSDTPFQVSENDRRKVSQSAKRKSFCRGGMCMLFQVRGQKGKKFFFLNSHSALNKEDHLKYAHVYVDMEKKFNPDGYPSFFVGDLNARPNHPSHEVFRQWWSDCWDAFPDQKGASFNSFKTDPTQWKESSRIDYIYYRNVSAPVRFQCNRSLYDGFLASDHFPIWADFEL